MHNSANSHANSMPKRSRPAWLDSQNAAKTETPKPPIVASKSEVTTPAPVRTKPSVIAGQKVDDSVKREDTKAVPIARDKDSTSVRDSRSWKYSFPKLSSPESILVSHYATHHYPGDEYSSQLDLILCSASLAAGMKFSIVGSHVNGTWSELNVPTIGWLPLDEPIDLDRSEIADKLKLHGAKQGWTVSPLVPTTAGVLLQSVAKPTFSLYILVDQKVSNTLKVRNEFIRTYVHIVEPKLAVAACLIREWLFRTRPTKLPDLSLHAVDHMIFVLVWKALVHARMIPLLVALPQEEFRYLVPEIQQDQRIWSQANSSNIQGIRSDWKQNGIRVCQDISVERMIEKFVLHARIVLDPEYGEVDANICPITRTPIFDEGVSVPVSKNVVLRWLWRTVCSSEIRFRSKHI